MKTKKTMFEDVAFDKKGFPHKRFRNARITPSGKLIPGKAVQKLPKGWSWKKK